MASSTLLCTPTSTDAAVTDPTGSGCSTKHVALGTRLGPQAPVSLYVHPGGNSWAHRILPSASARTGISPGWPVAASPVWTTDPSDGPIGPSAPPTGAPAPIGFSVQALATDRLSVVPPSGSPATHAATAPLPWPFASAGQGAYGPAPVGMAPHRNCTSGPEGAVLATSITSASNSTTATPTATAINPTPTPVHSATTTAYDMATTSPERLTVARTGAPPPPPCIAAPAATAVCGPVPTSAGSTNAFWAALAAALAGGTLASSSFSPTSPPPPGPFAVQPISGPYTSPAFGLRGSHSSAYTSFGFSGTATDPTPTGASSRGCSGIPPFAPFATAVPPASAPQPPLPPPALAGDMILQLLQAGADPAHIASALGLPWWSRPPPPASQPLKDHLLQPATAARTSFMLPFGPPRMPPPISGAAPGAMTAAAVPPPTSPPLPGYQPSPPPLSSQGIATVPPTSTTAATTAAGLGFGDIIATWARLAACGNGGADGVGRAVEGASGKTAAEHAGSMLFPPPLPPQQQQQSTRQQQPQQQQQAEQPARTMAPTPPPPQTPLQQSPQTQLQHTPLSLRQHSPASSPAATSTPSKSQQPKSDDPVALTTPIRLLSDSHAHPRHTHHHRHHHRHHHHREGSTGKIKSPPATASTARPTSAASPKNGTTASEPPIASASSPWREFSLPSAESPPPARSPALLFPSSLGSLISGVATNRPPAPSAAVQAQEAKAPTTSAGPVAATAVSAPRAATTSPPLADPWLLQPVPSLVFPSFADCTTALSGSGGGGGGSGGIGGDGGGVSDLWGLPVEGGGLLRSATSPPSPLLPPPPPSTRPGAGGASPSLALTLSPAVAFAPSFLAPTPCAPDARPRSERLRTEGDCPAERECQ